MVKETIVFLTFFDIIDSGLLMIRRFIMIEKRIKFEYSEIVK